MVTPSPFTNGSAIPPAGIEQLEKTLGISTDHSDLVQNPVHPLHIFYETHPDLARLIEAWPTLSTETRQAILSLVEG
jgi:hypothetical protein